MSTRHDFLVLRLIWRRSLNALRATRVSTLLQLLALGGFFLAYSVADLAVDLRRAAPALRRLEAFWLFGLPAMACLAGAATGALLAGAAAAQAQAPFLLALPVSQQSRWRAAAIAALALTQPPAALFGLAIWAACVVVDKPGAACLRSDRVRAFSGRRRRRNFCAAARGFPGGRGRQAGACARKTPPRLLRRLDRARPAGLGQWSWGLAPRRAVLGLGAAFAILAALAAGASYVQRQAAPAVGAGAVGALVLFMLTLRCDPLASPVLRAAPLGFFRAWSALLRFPLALASAFYAGPAAAAVAGRAAGAGPARRRRRHSAGALRRLRRIRGVLRPASRSGRRQFLRRPALCHRRIGRIWPARAIRLRRPCRLPLDLSAEKIPPWMTC